jgi:hypothetical protein
MGTLMKTVEMKADSAFISVHARTAQEIPYTRNNCVCYDFKENGIVRTHCAIRSNSGGAGNNDLKLWVIEISGDGHREENEQLSGNCFTGTSVVAGGGDRGFTHC